MILRPGSHDSYLCGDLQLVHHLHQKRGSPQQRLEERNPEVRPQEGQRNSRQPSATPYVDHRGVRFDQAAQCGAVENVPLPQPARFLRTKQPVRDSLGGQYVDILTNAGGLVPVQLENNLLGSCGRALVTGPDQAGWTTTCRRGSSPSDSLVRPAATTASCTILRSNGFIGASGTRSLVFWASDTASASQPDELLAAALAVTGDVQHQAATAAGLAHHGQPGQLLQRVEDFTVGTDEHLGVADDGDVGAVSFDVGVDVPVEIGDVEQFLEVVGGDLRLGLQGVGVVVDPF